MSNKYKKFSPSLTIEALEDCLLFSIKYKEVQSLYDNLKKGERFGRLMS